MAKALRGANDLRPSDPTEANVCESVANDGLGNVGGGQWVFNDGVEAAEDGTVQHLGMIGRCDKEALRLVLFKELEEGVENSPDFAHIVGTGPFATERVDL